ITENAMMEDPAHALDILKSLSDMGISLAIDDFGSGYSSLAYLSKLPVNELKIDKSFVSHMVEKEDDATIVRSVIELARNFKLRAVAEGVENKETWDMLRNLGCDHAQGYHMSRPLPLNKLKEWMRESPWGLSQA
ncbi:MAG: EAL domain-containing protein, partial [Burkholderiales bacterium]|nr:EAL domain-containing protein [Burkholderiales bacterium]